jgi:hypothetical protein
MRIAIYILLAILVFIALPISIWGRKVVMYILLGLLALIVIPITIWGGWIIIDLGNPLRQSVEQIREDILELTPIGMGMDDVVEILEAVGNDRKWWPLHINNNRGVVMGELGRSGATVGVQSIRVNMGGYRGVFYTSVLAWWAFDENSELIDVFVTRQSSGW